MRARLRQQGWVGVLLVLFAFALRAQDVKTEVVQGNEVAAQEVLVQFNPAAQSSVAGRMPALLSALDADRVEGVGAGNLLLIHSRTKDAASLIQELAADPDVEFAEPNYIYHTTDTIPDDPLFPQLWGLQNTTTPGADISAYLAWDITTGSAANVVGVIDTGIDYTHPDLAANVWTAPAAFSVTIGGRTINCPAGSHGYRPAQRTCDPAETRDTHGTHVSGTIGAVGNNGLGVTGVNWTASVMVCKMFDTGGGTLANAIDCIDFAIQTKQYFAASGGANVRVLSNSWGGGGFSQALLDAIYRANDSDMLFAVAAGNNNRNIDLAPLYPASYDAPNILAVASTTSRDLRSGFSNYGPNTVHLGAPGSSITSTVRGGGYGRMSGTSMSTPHVSGAAALVLSVCDLDTATLKTTLVNTVDVIPALSDITISGGRLNVYNAILACAGAATN